MLDPSEHQRCQELLEAHHDLKGIRAVGEQLFDMAENRRGQWLALSGFCAAAKHLRQRSFLRGADRTR
ncbi:MAG: hypothetical protein HY360_15415 [Verrucomicrobia bacterium]|nr:hypothetical protein [Verrucomicrobiota bacterium]